MTKREEYINALKIVEEYHKKLNRAIEKHSFSKIKYLKENDFVKCIRLKNRTKTCLTIGKQYQIIRFSYNKFAIIDDNGNKKSYRLDNLNFEAVTPDYA